MALASQHAAKSQPAGMGEHDKTTGVVIRSANFQAWYLILTSAETGNWSYIGSVAQHWVEMRTL